MRQLLLDGVLQDRAGYPPGKSLIRHLSDGLRVRVFYTPEEMGPSKTDDSQAENLDLNVILRRYVAAGIEPEVGVGEFGDVTDIGSFQDVQVRLAEVRSVFMTLKPDMRERFRNDPAVFADFVSDPNNFDDGVAIGLYKPPKEDPTSTAGSPKAAEAPTPKVVPDPVPKAPKSDP